MVQDEPVAQIWPIRTFQVPGLTDWSRMQIGPVGADPGVFFWSLSLFLTANGEEEVSKGLPGTIMNDANTQEAG